MPCQSKAMWRLVRNFAYFAVMALCFSVSAHAQYFYILDPNDPSTYRHWSEKNYQYAVKLSSPTYAGQVVNHSVNKASEVATPEVDPKRSNGPAAFWGTRVPEWVKGQVKNPFTGAGVTGQDETISKMWQGLSVYQRARAVLKSVGLIRASLRGLRFDVDAWRMMSNILAIDNTTEGGAKLGTVTFSVVPKGQGTLEALDKYLDDPLYHDVSWSKKLKTIGTKALGDMSLMVESMDDTGVTQGSGESGSDTVYRWLEAVDRGARLASEEIAAIQAYSNQKRASAIRDSMSPRALQNQINQSIAKTRQKYRSLEAMRALLEGRGADEISLEYDRLATAMTQEAQAAVAQAELHNTFYANMQNQADNIVSTLNNQARLADIDALEKQLLSFIKKNNSSEITDMVKDYIKSLTTNLKSFVNTPSTNTGTADTAMEVPYANVVTSVVDVGAVTKTADPDSSAKDGASPVTSMLKEYQIKAMGVRMGYHLWEELRAVRQLMMLKEQRDMALRGIQDGNAAEASYQRAMALARERELGLAKLKFLNTKVNTWLQRD